MNQLETKVLLNLLHQNEQLVALIGRLLAERDDARHWARRLYGEAHHARLTARDGAGADVGRDMPTYEDHVAANKQLDAEWDARAAEYERAHSLLQPALGLGADRPEPRADDSARADPNRRGGLWISEIDGLPVDPEQDDPGDRGGLHSSPGPAAGAEPGDRGGDSLPPGADGARPADGRVDDGDAGARTDCRYQICGQGKYDWEGGETPCTHCGDYEPAEPVPPAPPPVVATDAKTKHCPRCDRDLPLDAFNKGARTCQECLLTAREENQRATAARRHRRELAQDPGYQNGLRAWTAAHPTVGRGICPGCDHDAILYQAEDGARCRACLQAAEREKGHCVICGHTIIGRRSTATTCGPECQREAHRRQCAEYYEKKKEARAGAPA